MHIYSRIRYESVHSSFLQCSSDSVSAVPLLLLAEKIVMTMWGVYLAYATRNVLENWNESMPRRNFVHVI